MVVGNRLLNRQDRIAKPATDADPVPLADDALYQSAIVGHTSLVRLDDDWIGVGQSPGVHMSPENGRISWNRGCLTYPAGEGCPAPRCLFGQTDWIMQEMPACR